MEHYDQMIGMTVLDMNGDKVGKLTDLYTEGDDNAPDFATVESGLFGSRTNFFPLRSARVEDGHVIVDIDKDKIHNAPSIDANGVLSGDEEAELFNYYLDELGEGRNAAKNGDGEGEDDEEAGPGHDTSGPTTDKAMTRSEEELDIHKAQRETGTVRLKKYVRTENVTTIVPVQREEVRVVRESVDDDNIDDATNGPDLSEEEHEMTLHEEVPVVDKNVVPKERVRLDKAVVEDEQTVSEDVRKEDIQLDDRDAKR